MPKNYYVDNYPLDDYQMQLLNCEENCIVIAGAGAGKTLTILGKINYLIESKTVNEQDILVISFTNASVSDIKKRIKYNVPVYTFHKLAMFILEKAHFEYQICSTTLLQYIIKEEVITCNKQMQENIIKFLKIDLDFTKFCQTYQFQSFCHLIETFINLWKTNALKFKDIPMQKYTKLEKKILYFIFKIYKKYISEKQSTNLLDFDDLIFKATEITKNIPLNFKYIIIDEFQDTSYIRLNLIREIYKFTNAKVIVVGDDWQSIYRFSGCDLNIFLNFQQFFPAVKEVKLVNTYRNSQDLINIASTFIKKNPLQIDKSLKSFKNNPNPFIFTPYKNKIYKLKKVLNTILKTSMDIMILTRNNKDIFEYIDEDYQIISPNQLEYQGVLIKLYTVHKSKGLEAENVIILNCNDDLLGFPNQIEDNIILKKLFPNKEINYAEERRLFYVAITRCKEKTYLLYDKDKPSIFIIEMKKIVKKQLKTISYFKD